MRAKTFTSLDHKTYSERDIYLTLIGMFYVGRDPIDLHKRNDDYNIDFHLNDIDRAVEYARLIQSYNQHYERCLQIFDGKKTEDFTTDFKEAVRSSFNRKSVMLVNQITSISKEKIRHQGNRTFFSYENFKYTRDKDSELMSVIESARNYYACEDNEGKEDTRKWEIFPMQIVSPTTLNKLERKLNQLCKYGVINDALQFVELRIGIRKVYKFRWLVSTIDEIFEDLMINKSSGKAKASKLDKQLKDLVNEAANNYEVIDNPDYLISDRSYKAALRSNFESKLKTINQNGG
ncbi:MAG: hypothetical protein WD098_01960 [Balneolales bacterium]